MRLSTFHAQHEVFWSVLDNFWLKSGKIRTHRKKTSSSYSFECRKKEILRRKEKPHWHQSYIILEDQLSAPKWLFYLIVTVIVVVFQRRCDENELTHGSKVLTHTARDDDQKNHELRHSCHQNLAFQFSKRGLAQWGAPIFAPTNEYNSYIFFLLFVIRAVS